MKHLTFLLFSVAALAQSEVRLSQRSSDQSYQQVLLYTGTNVTTICSAQSIQPTSPSISIASATNASPVVFTVTAGHGFNTSTKPTVVIFGGTGNWTAVNLTATATIISSTTFSIVVDSTSLGAVTGALTYTSRSPLLTNRVWSVKQLAYDGSNNTVMTAWANGVSSYTQTCSAAPSAFQ